MQKFLVLLCSLTLFSCQALFLEVYSSPSSAQVSASDVSQIMEFFNGMDETNEITHEQMKQCLEDETSLVNDFNQAINSLQKEEVVEGMTQLALMMNKMYQQPKCGFMKYRFQNILDMLSQITLNPFEIVRNIRMNSHLISTKLQLFFDQVVHFRFFEAGRTILSILKLIVTRHNAPTLIETSPASVQIMEGVLVGFGTTASKSFQGCLSDDVVIMRQVQQAVQDFQVGTAAGTMSGIVNLSKVAKEIPIAMAKCQIVINDFEKLQKTIEMMNSPVDFVYHVERDIMINKVQLYQDVQRIVRDYNDEKWFDLGTALGNALDKLLVGADMTY